MLHRSEFENYEIYNVSSNLYAYGYIYYASLSAGESYAIRFLLALMTLIGCGATMVLMAAHICAICFAYNRLYKPVRQPLNAISTTVSQVEIRRTRDRCCSFSPIQCIHAIGRKIKNRLYPSPARVRASPTASHDTNVNPNVIVNLSDVFEKNNSRSSFPGVSIIKPMAGLDPNLEANLTSFFYLDYPNYEILFCVSDENDPSCKLIRRLQSYYPNISSQLLIATTTVGVNPKINNLQVGYEASRFDLILVSDSGIWMNPNALTDMVTTLTSEKDIGIIHQVPFVAPHVTYNTKRQVFKSLETGIYIPTHLSAIYPQTSTERPSFAWITQLIFFGCWHAKLYLFAAYFGINCVTGMSILLRKPVLNSIGGFKSFGCYLAEDYFLAKYYLSQGWRIRVSNHPAWQNSPATTLTQFGTRLSRWCQLRLSMVFIAYFLEPLSRCLPNALFGAFAFSNVLPQFIDPGVYFLCHLLVWFLMDYILLLCVYPPSVPLSITKLEYAVGWLFSELIAVPFHFSALFKRELHWRDKRFRLFWGGISERIDEEISCESVQIKCQSQTGFKAAGENRHDGAQCSKDSEIRLVVDIV